MFSKFTKFFTKRPFIFLIIFVFIIISIWYWSWCYIDSTIELPANRGTFGDKFGFINSLFSGLAFAGLAYTIYIQHTELLEQKQQFKQSEYNISIKEFLKELDSSEQKLKRGLLHNLYKSVDDWIKNNKIEYIREKCTKEELLFEIVYKSLNNTAINEREVLQNYFRGKLDVPVVQSPNISGYFKKYLRDSLYKGYEGDMGILNIFKEICTFYNFWGNMYVIGLLPIYIFRDDSGRKTIENYNKLSMFIKKEREENPQYCEHFELLVEQIYKDNIKNVKSKNFPEPKI
jgi:hypothetical protein